MTGLELVLTVIIGAQSWYVWHQWCILGHGTRTMREASKRLDWSNKEIVRLRALLAQWEHEHDT